MGPPDDVEALAGPVPGEPGERAERIRRCGQGSCGRRRRFFDWRQWPENKVCGRFHDPPLAELEPESERAHQLAERAARLPAGPMSSAMLSAAVNSHVS